MSNFNIFEKYTDKATFERIVDYENVAKMWEASVAEFPSNVAVIDGDARYTFAELDAEIAKFRYLLSQNGVAEGDKVGVLAPNSANFIKAYFAINTLGAVAVLLPAHLDQMTVFGCTMKFGMNALV